MARCGQCGGTLDESAVACPVCGGTVIPSQVERGLQPLHRPGDILSGRFRVERILGSGGSGVVYGVHDAHTDRRVALKVLWERSSPEDPTLQRLRREIQASQFAPSPRCVAVYDLLFVQDHPAILMEWVEGETLRDKIRRQGALPWEEAVATACQVLDAMAHLHAAGVVHRDIKSGNVMLAADGSAKLGDFGLAKGDILGGGTLTETGATLGTPGYMAPEVIRGGAATPASDLYSLGAMLFEMLTGRMPYQGNSALEVASRQLSEAPPLELLKEKKVPRWLARITARLLERDPADRLPSTKVALNALEERRSRFWMNRRQRIRIGASALLILAACGAFALWDYRRREVPLALNFHDKILEARDPEGRVIWERELPRDIQSACYGAAGPGGRPTAACSINWGIGAKRSGSDQTQFNAIHFFDRQGNLLRWAPVTMASNPLDPHYEVMLSSHRFAPRLPNWLVVQIRHDTWFPTELQVWESDRSRADAVSDVPPFACSIYNSGHITSWAPADIDGDGVEEILFAAINNRLFRSNAVGAVRLAVKPGEPGPEALSPDVSSRPSSRPLFYRLISFERDSPAAAPTRLGSGEIQVKTVRGDTFLFAPDGSQVRGGAAAPLSIERVNALNAQVARLCDLKDAGRYVELLDACRDWKEDGPGPYGWIGRLFRSYALMGLGRYGEASGHLESAIAAENPTEVPLYAYQYLVDCAFLEGDYAGCLKRYADRSVEVKRERAELSQSALWAALYAGDPQVEAHFLKSATVIIFDWYREIARALILVLDGHLKEAETFLDGVYRNEARTRQPNLGLWYVDVLCRRGNLAKARKVMGELEASFPAQHLSEDEMGLWLRYCEGDRSVQMESEMDSLLARKRAEARVSVEARALLPFTLARAARVHRDAGDAAGARALQDEAYRLAPKHWRPGLKF